MRAKATAYFSSVNDATSSGRGSRVIVDDSHRDHATAAGTCTSGSGSASSRLYARMRCPRSSNGTGSRKPSHRSGNSAAAPPS